MGATENAAPSKMQGWKTRGWKTQHQCVGGAKCDTEYYETPECNNEQNCKVNNKHTLA